MKTLKKLFNNILAFFLPIAIGVLAAYGGASGTSKGYRRFGIPVILAMYAFTELENAWVFTMLALIGVFSLGYGVPDATDSGSDLGRFWYSITNQNHFLTDIFTRGTIGLLMCLAVISLPIIKGNWKVCGLASLFLIITYSVISWQNLGTYKLFGKDLLWSETIAFLCVSGAIISMIKL